MAKPVFIRKEIAQIVNKGWNSLLLAGDLNNDGMVDLIVSGRDGRMVWLENKNNGTEWIEHYIDEADRMECGGSLYDVTGNGYLDLINGTEGQKDELFWWENPGEKGGPWRKRLILKTGNKQFHDTITGDVKGDGKNYLIAANQGRGTTVYCIPFPEDPTVSPWPDYEIITTGKRLPNPYHPWNPEGFQPDEGLAIGDLDGDGKNELVCGIYWYKYRDGKWEEHKFADDYYTTKIAVADINGDGRNEIILSEGDPCIYGMKRGGKLAWFKPGKDIYDMWEEHIIEQGLFDAHTLKLGDICSNGRLDILTGEVGEFDRKTDQYIIRQPRVLVYENDGKGNFTRHVIDEGTGTHESALVDLRGTGRLDIVGKPLHGPNKWSIIVWYNNGF